MNTQHTLKINLKWGLHSCKKVNFYIWTYRCCCTQLLLKDPCRSWVSTHLLLFYFKRGITTHQCLKRAVHLPEGSDQPLPCQNPVTSPTTREMFTVATLHMTSGPQFKTRNEILKSFLASFSLCMLISIENPKTVWLRHELNAVTSVFCATFSSQKIQTCN